MRLISWNLNGLLSSIKNGVFEAMPALQLDMICLQEIRTAEEPEILKGYHHFWNHGSLTGYSGTCVLTRGEPVSVVNGFFSDFPDTEGRIITVELPNAYVVNVYIPNSQGSLRRHAFRLEWDEALREHAACLMESKPVIICGDFNVARQRMDIFDGNMKQYWAQQGYESDERSDFETLLEEGLIDTFRTFHPDEQSFTWWSNRLNKRKQNRGWRLDYFLITESLKDQVKEISHLSYIEGSDHCPILLDIAL